MSFNYHYYGISSDTDFGKGSLLGPSPKDDLPFQSCAPTQESRYPCVVLRASDFFQFKQEYLDLKNRLESCEKGNKWI